MKSRLLERVVRPNLFVGIGRDRGYIAGATLEKIVCVRCPPDFPSQ